MKILSNKKYNDLISKQFRGIFADVNDDNLLRENGLLYGENKELKQELERLNNIINIANKKLKNISKSSSAYNYQCRIEEVINILQELKGSDKE